jgi:Pyridoxamine 5'-phosphate oxidase
VLTTYRKDGSAHTVPVWFRWTDEALEVVIAKGDVKLRRLARDPRCVLVVFEAVRPFRGLEVREVGELVEGDATAARVAIARRYLGVADGGRFAAERRSRPGVLLRLVPDSRRVSAAPVVMPTAFMITGWTGGNRRTSTAAWAMQTALATTTTSEASGTDAPTDPWEMMATPASASRVLTTATARRRSWPWATASSRAAARQNRRPAPHRGQARGC